MADTNFNQATLDQVEAVITYVLSQPKEAQKGQINFDEGGAIVYRSFDELINIRNNIKKILDNESDLDLDAAKKSAYRPFGQSVSYEGNL